MNKNIIDVVKVKMIRDKKVSYKSITAPNIAAEIAGKLIQNDLQEHMILFCLDTRNHINAARVLSIGTENACLVSPREIIRTALLSASISCLLVHNHPSGNTAPSDEDISVTMKIQKGLDLVDIKLLDHVIINNISNDYFSMSEKGIL